MRWTSPLLIALAAGALTAQPSNPDTDERLLRDAKIATDDAGLLHFFRERTLSGARVEQLKGWLQELGSKNFSTRNHAAQELVKAGLNAKALLRETMQNPKAEQEIARRAELCMRQIDDGQEIVLAQAAARMLQKRRPPEAARVLIDYVPFAVDPQVLAAVQDALNVVAVRQGQADPAVLQAARDAHVGKRIAAGVALARAGGAVHKPAIAHLLKDESIHVRFPVTIALVEAKDKDAVPLLIDRLADAPKDRTWQALELLERLAGERGPPVYPSARTTPAQVRDAWQKWWADNAARVDLAKLSETPPYLGFTLISVQAPTKVVNGNVVQGSGKLIELRPDRSVHWEIPDLNYPVDARVIGTNRVLVAEYLGRRVTERDFAGNILWEIPQNLPIGCQRLPGGDTFIVTRTQLVIVDREKRTLFSHFHQNGSISAATRLRDGSMVLVASTGQCHWLDSQGRETKQFPVGYVYATGGSIEVLPNRHVLVPLYRDGKVAEFDLDGKMVWQVATPNPVSASRLPNGNTLVVSITQRIIEIDRQGQTVWNYGVEGRAWRARGR